MSFEPGGRSGKLGDYYETAWLLHQYLRLLKEEVKFVMYEAVGADEQGVDIWVTDLDSKRTCYQCKARNGTSECWTLGDLASENIFRNMCTQLNRNSHVEFEFVSAAGCLSLRDLITRAKNNAGNGQRFYEDQILTSGKDTKSHYNQFCRYMNLTDATENIHQLALDYLRRITVTTFPGDDYSKAMLAGELQRLFIGNVDSMVSKLSIYALEKDMLGKEITANDLLKYLIDDHICLKPAFDPSRILPTVIEINEKFKKAFTPINSTMFERPEVELCYEALDKSSSLLLYGRAGFGKSGCIQSLSRKMDEQGILYIAIKLDKYTPYNNANSFGQTLGLPHSPILTLNDLSPDKKCYLILDQLDAIRWKKGHISSAIDVIDELIRQANQLNTQRQEKIGLIIACRTFDYKNDPAIQNLLETNENFLQWANIEVGNIPEATVQGIVGTKYPYMSVKEKELLANPGNLYIWSRLNEDSKKTQVTHISNLIERWWDQLVAKCEESGIPHAEVNGLKDALISKMETSGLLTLPLASISNNSKRAREALASHGLIYVDDGKVSFVHQTFFDYFLVQQSFTNIIEKKSSILHEIPIWAEQFPATRFRLQLLLENLLDYDIDLLIQQGRMLLGSDKVRYYYQFTFLEVLGEAASITASVESCLDFLLQSDIWKENAIRTVLMFNPIFVKHLYAKGILGKWLSDPLMETMAYSIMASAVNILPSETIELLQEKLKQSPNSVMQAYQVLDREIAAETDDIFEFRMQLLASKPEMLNRFFVFDDFANKCPSRALRIIVFALAQGQNLEGVDSHKKDTIEYLTKHCTDEVLNTLLPLVFEKTCNFTYKYDRNFWGWRGDRYNCNVLFRQCVRLIVHSFSELISRGDDAILRLKPYLYEQSLIVKEIVLSVFELLPLSESDFVIKYLAEDLDGHAKEHTSSEDSDIAKAKRIISRFSPVCSPSVFEKLENAITVYHEASEVARARRRFEHNHKVRHCPDESHNYTDYYPYWGRLQKALLPILDEKRISLRGRELMSVLNRNTSISADAYARSPIMSGTVTSILSKKAHTLSDKAWLKIINNPSTASSHSDRWDDENGVFWDSSYGALCRSYQSIGEKNPLHYGKLSLLFDDSIPTEAARAAISLIGQTEVDEGDIIDVTTAEKMMQKFGAHMHEHNYPTELCRVLEKRSREQWSEASIRMIGELATTHPDPSPGQYHVWGSDDKESEKIDSIFTNSLNCVRGCAVHTIADMLWDEPGRYSLLREYIEKIIDDTHPSIIMAAYYVLIPLYNIARPDSEQWFIKLMQKDNRILALHRSWELIIRYYGRKTDSISSELEKLFNADEDDLAEKTATHITALWLFRDCAKTNFEKMIFDRNNRKCQFRGITKQVAATHATDPDEKTRAILNFLFDEVFFDEDGLIQLVRKNTLKSPDDNELIQKLLVWCLENNNMRWFLDIVLENNIDLLPMTLALLKKCQTLKSNLPENTYYDFDSLINTVIVLMDQAHNDVDKMNMCMDIWDVLYKEGFGNARQLTKALNEY